MAMMAKPSPLGVNEHNLFLWLKQNFGKLFKFSHQYLPNVLEYIIFSAEKESQYLKIEEITYKDERDFKLKFVFYPSGAATSVSSVRHLTFQYDFYILSTGGNLGGFRYGDGFCYGKSAESFYPSSLLEFENLLLNFGLDIFANSSWQHQKRLKKMEQLEDIL